MATPLWLQKLRSTLNRRQIGRSRSQAPPRARPRVDVLEDRTLLTASWLQGAGVIGDSFGSPYFNGFGPNTHSWVEALADLRGINFGGQIGGSYAYDSYTPNTYSALATTVPALAAQISAGQVNLAIDEVGGHDFIWNSIPSGPPWEQTPGLSPSIPTVFSDIYNGFLAGPQLQAYVNQVLGNEALIHQQLFGAGANVVAFNFGDFSVAPAIALSGFTDPAGLARVTNSYAAANVQYQALAAQEGIPLVDFYGFSHLVTSGHVVVGGISLDLTHFSSPANPFDFFADAQHAGTVAQGLLANMVIAAADRTYGAGIAPLTDQEILQYAGITPPTSGPTYFDISPFVTPNAGALDLTFGSVGVVTTNLGSLDDEATNVFVQPNGEILVVGITQPLAPTSADYALTISRYTSNGNPDRTFGSNGTVVTGLTTPTYYYHLNPNQLVCEPNGSLVVLWPVTDSSGNMVNGEVVRFLPNGSIDTSFGDNGRVAIDGITPVVGYTGIGSGEIAVQSDGKILIAGSVVLQQSPGIVDTTLERLNVNGTVDTSFGTSGTGMVIQDFGIQYPSAVNTDQSFPTAIAVRPDGTILVAGDAYSNANGGGNDGFVAQFHSNGTLDTNFGVPGVGGGEVILVDAQRTNNDNALPNAVTFKEEYAFLDTSVWSMLLQTDGRILLGIAGSMEIRLNENGTLDTGFGQNPDGHYGMPGAPGVEPVIEDTAGRILASITGGAVGRFNADGTLDLSFGFDGYTEYFFDTRDHVAPDLAVQSDGNIVVVGTTFNTIKHGWDIALGRLQAGAMSVTTQAAVTSQVNQIVNTAVLSGQTDQVTFQAGSQADVNTMLAAINALAPANSSAPTVTVTLDLGGGNYSTGGVTVNPPAANVNFVIQNGTLDPSYPALTVAGGHVTVLNCTLLTTGDAPTILVTGGRLTLRNDIVQESTGFNDAAIFVTGGTVDLGTVASPGGNTININGTGSLVTSTLAIAIPAVGDTFENNGVAINPFNVTSVTASSNPSLLNQPVTFTATVSPAVAGGSPSGTVQFQVDGSSVGAPVALSGGSANFLPSTLALGPHTVTAIYSGDGYFLGSFGTLSQSVQYHFSGFLAPLNSNIALALNRTVPIKFQLTDHNSKFITSLSAVTSLQVLNAQGQNVLTNAGSTALRYDSTANQFIANWQTKGLPAGSYTVTLVLADGTTYTKTVTLSKTGSASGLTTTTAGGTSSTAGALLGGNIELYVDNSNGDLTAAELARIQDAVTAVDALTEPYGVKVEEVTDPTLADVKLNMDTTSAVGGYADGVLGCTTDAGQITLISGWNFYAGSDATQIGSAQYDFETVLTHELGHALGLGHSTDSTSVMYATLSTGTVNRSLTAADLNVAGSDTTGACGLHAAGSETRAERGIGGVLPMSDPARTLLFALAGRESMGSGGREAMAFGSPSLAGRDQFFAALGSDWLAGQDRVKSPIASPIFAAPTPREEDDALFDVPLFPIPSLNEKDDAAKLEGVGAAPVERSGDAIPAQLEWLDN